MSIQYKHGKKLAVKFNQCVIERDTFKRVKYFITYMKYAGENGWMIDRWIHFVI